MEGKYVCWVSWIHSLSAIRTIHGVGIEAQHSHNNICKNGCTNRYLISIVNNIFDTVANLMISRVEFYIITSKKL